MCILWEMREAFRIGNQNGDLKPPPAGVKSNAMDIVEGRKPSIVDRSKTHRSVPASGPEVVFGYLHCCPFLARFRPRQEFPMSIRSAHDRGEEMLETRERRGELFDHAVGENSPAPDRRSCSETPKRRSIYPDRQFVEAGKLMVYGIDVSAGGKWHATQVIRVRERLSRRA
jgi:hypothetical protein